MKKLSVFLIMMFISGLTFAQVSFDYDRSADFTKYKTYAFKGWEKDSDKKLPELDKKRVMDAFKAEFAKKGLELSESDPDLDITLYIVIEDKTSTTAYTTFNGGMGYGWGRWGYGGGMGTASTNYTQDDYKEGTMVIDFYDHDTKQLAWQGTIKKTVGEKPAKREKTIPKDVASLMKNYPPKK